MKVGRRIGIAGAGLLAAGAAVAGATATASNVADWKGAEWLTVSAPAVNAARCGSPADQNFELHFTGSGIDTARGTFAVTASACIDMDTLHVTDLRATDRFAGSGDTVEIRTSDFTLEKRPGACVATNRSAVKFTVAGGTGGLAGAKGSGHFDTAVNLAGCETPAQPAYVWFEGEIQTQD